MPEISVSTLTAASQCTVCQPQPQRPEVSCGPSEFSVLDYHDGHLSRALSMYPHTPWSFWPPRIVHGWPPIPRANLSVRVFTYAMVTLTNQGSSMDGHLLPGLTALSEYLHTL